MRLLVGLGETVVAASVVVFDSFSTGSTIGSTMAVTTIASKITLMRILVHFFIFSVSL